MNINKYVTDDGVTILRITGKLISSSVDKLKASLDAAIEADDVKLVMNCKNVNIIDSAVVGLLISRSRAAKKKGGHFCFCEPQPAIYKLLTMVDIDKWLEVYPTESEALASLQTKTNTKAGP